MDAKSIIAEISQSKEYYNLCKSIAKGSGLHDDLFQELLLILLEYNQEKIKLLYDKGELKWFIARILKNQHDSRTSKFNKVYRALNDTVEINNETEIKEDLSDPYTIEILDYEQSRESFKTKEEWYANNLLRAYLKEGGYRKLERKTGISRAAIRAVLERVFESIRLRAKIISDFMQTEKIVIDLPPYIKQNIFRRALIMGTDPISLTAKQLSKINKPVSFRNKPQGNQLELFQN